MQEKMSFDCCLTETKGQNKFAYILGKLHDWLTFFSIMSCCGCSLYATSS